MAFSQILGWAATFLFTVCFVPQIVKTIRTQSIEGLSVAMLVVQVAANLIALVYAMMIDQSPLVVKYVLALAVLAGTLGVVLRVLVRQRGWDRRLTSRAFWDGVRSGFGGMWPGR